MSQYWNIEAIKAKVKDITALNRTPDKTVKKSDKAKQIEHLCRNISNRTQMLKIFSLLLDEPLNGGICPLGYYPFGCMVVLTGKYSSHNYPLNEPVLVDNTTNRRSGLKMDGTVGNNLPTIKTKKIRCATNEEIDEFFEKYDYLCGKSWISSFIAKI